MNKEVLKNYLNKIQELIDQSDKFIENTYDLCKIDFIDSTLYSSYAQAIDMCFDMICDIFTNNDKDKEGLFDTITWFFFEYYYNCKSKDVEMCIDNASMWDKDKNPICYDIDTLCDYIMSYNNIPFKIGDIVANRNNFITGTILDINKNGLVLIKPSKNYDDDTYKEPILVYYKNIRNIN